MKKDLNLLPLQARYVYIRLETSRFTNRMGFVHGSPTALSHECGISRAAFVKALRKLEEAGFVRWDESHDVILLRDYLLAHQPQNVNQIKHWAKVFSGLESESLRKDWLDGALRAATKWPDSFKLGFARAFAAHLPRGRHRLRRLKPRKQKPPQRQGVEHEDGSGESGQQEPSDYQTITLPDSHQGLGGAVIAPGWTFPLLYREAMPSTPSLPSPSYIPSFSYYYATMSYDNTILLSEKEEKNKDMVLARSDNDPTKAQDKDERPAAAPAPSSQPRLPNTEDVPAEPARARPASPVFITIPLVGKRKDGSQDEYEVTEDEVKMWQELYPAVDVRQTLRAIKGWNIANPTHRKTRKGIQRHINIWLQKEQDRARRFGGTKRPSDSLRPPKLIPLSPEEKRKLLEIPKEDML